MRTNPHSDRSRPGSETEAEARTRWFGLWDGYFAVCYLVAAVLVFNSGSAPFGSAFAMGAMTVMIVWYVSLGRRLMLRSVSSRRRAVIFAAGLLALFGIGVTFSLGAAVALFAVVPMLVIALPMPFAVPGLLLAHLWPVALVWLRGGDVNMTVLGILPLSLIGVTMSILLGLWISQVVRQSKDRAALIAELQLARNQVAQLSRDAGVATERERLSREIHDTLAQGLVSIVGLVQAAETQLQSKPALAREHLAVAGETAKENLAEARQFVRALTPPALQESSLIQAVRNLSETLHGQTTADISFSVDGPERRVPTEASVVLLRSAQEAMTNVRKHAQSAHHVDIGLAFTKECVSVTVQDDGNGTGGISEQHGYGIRSMRARALEVGGTLAVERTPAGGVRLTVAVPAATPTDEDATAV